MNKPRFSMTALFFFAFASTALAAAGPRVGNGGGTWVCRDWNGDKVSWIRLVDLFEAENEFGFQVENLSGGPWAILHAKLDLIKDVSPELNQLMAEHPVDLRKVLRFLPKSAGLTVIEDAAIRVRPAPESCPNGYLFYGQLANFTFDGRLLIATNLWKDEKFTDTERGALLIHEAVYKALREGPGDKNSSRVRQIVGILFSRMDSREQSERITAVLAQPVPTE